MKNTLILIILAFGLFSCTKEGPEPMYKEIPGSKGKADMYYHFTVRKVRYDISRPGMMYQRMHMIVHTPPHSMNIVYGKLSYDVVGNIIFKADNGKTFTFKF